MNQPIAIVTGCLRISKESIFTGLNNLKINSILSDNYAEYFGFTGSEVEEMLKNYVDAMVNCGSEFPQAYWSNTSSNSIIRELIESADGQVKEEIEQLIDGGTIEKPVYEDITYEDIHKTQDNLWNFLFFTGYLKVESKRFENRITYLTMSIPNDEVLTIYENTIREWFDCQVKAMDIKSFFRMYQPGRYAL